MVTLPHSFLVKQIHWKPLFHQTLPIPLGFWQLRDKVSVERPKRLTPTTVEGSPGRNGGGFLGAGCLSDSQTDTCDVQGLQRLALPSRRHRRSWACLAPEAYVRRRRSLGMFKRQAAREEAWWAPPALPVTATQGWKQSSFSLRPWGTTATWSFQVALRWSLKPSAA